MKNIGFYISLLLLPLTGCIRQTPVSITDKGSNASGNIIRMLTGSYGSAESDGIRLYEFNQNTGETRLINGLCGIPDPSFVEIAPGNRNFYAVSETDNGSDALFAAEIIGDEMHIINSFPTDGKAPCHVRLDHNRNRIFTANYNGASFTLFHIDEQTGALLPERTVKHFTDHSHIHQVSFTPDSAYIVINDLGNDDVMLFDVNDPAFKAVDNFVEKGSGPRHITFSPDGRFAYLINELSGTVTVLSYAGKPQLEIVQYATCDSVGGHGSADIHVSPDGRFLYASNRLKEDGISIFRIDSISGRIEKTGYQLTGIHPRNFAISPNGRFLLCACRDSNIIQVFCRKEDSGLLEDTGKSIQMPSPTCIQFFR